MRTKYEKSDIKAIAKVKDAVGFDRFCEDNNIINEWLEVTLTDFNDGYYNVVLPEYGLNVMYIDGVLEEINEN